MLEDCTHKRLSTKSNYQSMTQKISCAGGRHNMPRPCDLDLLTWKVVSESRVTWATSVPILVFLGLSVLDLGPMYATDRRQTSDIQTSDAHHRLMPPKSGHNKVTKLLGTRLPTQTCQYRKISRSRSTVGVQFRRSCRKFELSHSAFQGHSRSLKPTWIERLPTTS